MSSDTPRIKRYFTLHAIRTLYKFLAWLVVIGWVFVIIYSFIAGGQILSSESLVALIPFTLQWAIIAFTFYAASQIIDVVLSINEHQRQLIIQNRTLMRGIKRMLDRMDDLEHKQNELHERQHRILKKVDPEP